MSKSGLDSSVQFLPGIGPVRAKLLDKELGVKTVGDLLRLYPFRYIDRSTIIRIADIVPDTAYIQLRATVKRIELHGTVGGKAIETTATNNIKYNLVKRMSVWVSDGSGELELVFFKGIKWMHSKLQPGAEFIFFGKPSIFNGKINLVHPEVDAVGSQETSIGAGASMTGVYTSTEKLKNGGITNKVMTKVMEAALNIGLNEIEETIPEYLLKNQRLAPIKYAIRNIHFPQNPKALEKARYRLKFEELFFLQLSLLKHKYIRSNEEHGIHMPKVGQAFNQCYDALPFELTGAQKRVIKEIRDDMKSGHQMNRLLQGDVGSGKTLVAVLTALIAIGNGYQCCLMAPTEVLAQQHYKSIQNFLASTNVKSALLTGSSKTAERREIAQGLEDGSIGIIVGTHALIEDNVIFKNLGLAIIDEQHRFGVEQRAKLWQKSSSTLVPHILVMTATPIPRTLAMTLYGDLDVSIIDELPPGRKPIQTIHATEGKRPYLYNFMREQIGLGRQIFVVYPLIFESETLDYQNLENGVEDIIKAFPFPPYKTAVVHGQQTNDVKKFNMDAFAEGRAHILVSTSVIEVGVDVPNASVMVIESAERFGLSQLHQLRGRVGRGSEKSYCVLMTGYKLSKESKNRIKLMCSTEDGFVLAEEDMKMRGPGDLEGTQQSGLPISLNIASLAKDGRILNQARACAEAVLKADPSLDNPHNAVLVSELRKEKYEIKDYSKIS